MLKQEIEKQSIKKKEWPESIHVVSKIRDLSYESEITL
jgi:hypothetical protein